MTVPISTDFASISGSSPYEQESQVIRLSFDEMRFSYSSILALLGTAASLAAASPLASLHERAAPVISTITPSQWVAFNQSVGGNLHTGYPMAKPCYSLYNGTTIAPNPTQCANVQANYETDTFVANNYGGFMNVRESISSS